MNTAKITRWIAPCSTDVRPVPSVSVPTNRVSTSKVMLAGEMPSTRLRSTISETMATAGIVSPMLAIAEPSARLMLF